MDVRVPMSSESECLNLVGSANDVPCFWLALEESWRLGFLRLFYLHICSYEFWDLKNIYRRVQITSQSGRKLNMITSCSSWSVCVLHLFVSLLIHSRPLFQNVFCNQWWVKSAKSFCICVLYLFHVKFIFMLGYRGLRKYSFNSNSLCVSVWTNQQIFWFEIK